MFQPEYVKFKSVRGKFYGACLKRMRAFRLAKAGPFKTATRALDYARRWASKTTWLMESTPEKSTKS